jgi:imidazolonepropionase-like amidohydrolase
VRRGAAAAPPLEVLRAGTSAAGEALGRAPLGTLVEGAPADLLAVDGDPLFDLGRLERPRLVVAGGRVVLERQ